MCFNGNVENPVLAYICHRIDNTIEGRRHRVGVINAMASVSRILASPYYGNGEKFLLFNKKSDLRFICVHFSLGQGHL